MTPDLLQQIRAGGDSPQARRRHHGRQRSLGPAAGASPARRAPGGDEVGSGGSGGVHRDRESRSSPSLRSPRRTGTARPGRSRPSWAFWSSMPGRRRRSWCARAFRSMCWGNWTASPTRTRRAVDGIMEGTAGGGSLRLNLMISYSGREEILRAVRSLAREVAEGSRNPEDIDDDTFQGALFTRGLARSRPPHPDLRGVPNQQLHALAAGLHRDPHHSGAVARFHPARTSSPRFWIIRKGNDGSDG